MLTGNQRIEGGLWGLLIGDALGVPYEFKSPEGIPPLAEIEMEPPAGYPRSWPDELPGTWSDDGAHALCLLASLLYRGRLDLDDLGRRLLTWYDVGYMAVGGKVFDIGGTTRAALQRLRRGVPAVEAGKVGENANGNGALMRALPLALWHRGSDEELIRDAMLQSTVTHAHPRSQLCCALYCLWARAVLQEQANAWDTAVERMRRYCQAGSELAGELEAEILAWEHRPATGKGYVVDCLWSARHACEAEDYEQVVRQAIALGHDTDTTACVAGGIAGLKWGAAAIPVRWREALRESSTVQPLVDALLNHWKA